MLRICVQLATEGTEEKRKLSIVFIKKELHIPEDFVIIVTLLIIIKENGIKKIVKINILSNTKEKIKSNKIDVKYSPKI